MVSATGFIWKFLIGPIVADAQGVSRVSWQGITASTGYNLVNTSVWAALAALTGYGIYRLFEHKDLRFDRRTVMHSLPFVVLGGCLRFLEDAGAAPFELRVLLITPLIYFLIAGIYLSALGAAEKFSDDRDRFLLASGTVLTAPILVYSLSVIQNTGLLLQPLIISGALTLGSYLLVKDSIFDAPVYMAVIFSQFFGGAASMISLSQGYTQKQLLAQQATGVFGEPGILMVKAGVLAAAFYVLKDVKDEGLESLVILALLVVGLATGLRVALRVAAGL